MTIKEFDIRYGKKGGFKKMAEFRNECSTLMFIAKHFGVSKERVRQWMKEMFPDGYDPRQRRRELRVKTIQDLIKRLGMVEVRKLHFNKEYVKKALKNLKHEK